MKFFKVTERQKQKKKKHFKNFFLSAKQGGNKSLVGTELYSEISSMDVATDDWLDKILKEERVNELLLGLENKCIFFWGTFYKDEYGYLYIRYLYFSVVDGWASAYAFIGGYWDKDDLAFILQ